MTTSTISYITWRGNTSEKTKSVKKSATGQASLYQVTPLFFQETMEANSSYRINTGEEEVSLTFDQSVEVPESGNTSARSRQSVISGASTSTFRDTEVGQDEAVFLMHAQSLTSIVNNPKKDSMLKKMAKLVKRKVIGSSVP